MAVEFDGIFDALKPALAQSAGRLAVTTDMRTEYTLVSKGSSPFPQHKGEPMFFGSVRRGKAYVSFHLMPLDMCPELTKLISPALKKKMQGKTCFHFKKDPEPELVAELARLAEAGFEQWRQRKWV